MVQFEELRLSLLDYEEKLKQLREALGLDDMNKEIETLEAQTAEEDSAFPGGSLWDVRRTFCVLSRKWSAIILVSVP